MGHDPCVSKPGCDARGKGSSGRLVEAVGPDGYSGIAQGVPVLLLSVVESVVVCTRADLAEDLTQREEGVSACAASLSPTGRHLQILGVPLADPILEVDEVRWPAPAACLRVDDILVRWHAQALVRQEDRRQRLLPDASFDVDRLPGLDVDMRREEVDAPVEPLLVAYMTQRWEWRSAGR
jgi:hypothetical protein